MSAGFPACDGPGMDRINIPYSLKNIPLYSKSSYLNALVPKVTDFIQRLRWRAHIALQRKKKRNKDSDNDSDVEHEQNEHNDDKFGFRTTKSAPPVPALSGFENDLYHLISNLQFSNDKNEFQNKLSTDVKMINESSDAFVLADKTNNVYKVNANTYKKLLRDNVTAHYKKDNDKHEEKINKEAKIICQKLNIADRVQRIPQKQAFITLKDHKTDFRENTKCRLINPMKSEIGKISKRKLQSITRSLRESLQLNQWINTDDVLKWFEDLKFKSRQSFLTFDVEEFYPSISKDLFNRALDFATAHTPIPAEDREIFMHARSSLLHSQGDNWVKSTGLFDTTMGAYDGAECCELIGLFMLSEMKSRFPQVNIGLYRDDGLGAHRRIPGPELKKVREGIIQLFKENGLKIVIHTGLKQVDFLDVTLDLQSEKYKPYCKPNNVPSYLNVSSNHPPHIIRQIPKIISNRLNKLSCNEQDFNLVKGEYEDALRRSGYAEKSKLQFEKEATGAGDQTKKKKKQRKRKETFFCPPFASNMKTDFGRKFLNLVKTHFPKDGSLGKILNIHTIKLSYSCMPNMRALMLRHNDKLLRDSEPPAAAGCNCRKQPCPMQGNCLIESIVYEAKIHHDDKTVYYYGSTSNAFKTRWRNHTSSFRLPQKQNDTALASHVWEYNLNPSPKIEWRTVGTRKPVQPKGNCGICTLEKVTIMKNRACKPNTLNVRGELYRRCNHRDKHAVMFC